MSKQNHKLGPKVQNLNVVNKVVVVVGNTTVVGNSASKKPATNNSKNNVKSGEGNARSNCQRPSGGVQNTNADKNKHHHHGVQQNVPKNTFQQQQSNAKCQKSSGNTAKPQQPHYTNIKTSNQTNLQVGKPHQPSYTNIKTSNQTNVQSGSNPKPLGHGHQKNNTNKQGAHQVPFKNPKQNNSTPTVINVTQVVVNKKIVIHK